MAEAPEVAFSGDSLAVGGRRWRVEHPVTDARLLGGRVVVLYDPDARREPFGQFPNLVAFDLAGRPLWAAELPTNESGDCYVEIESAEPLRAYSWKSFSCELDPATGRIRRREFRK